MVATCIGRPATIPISEWWWLGIVIAVILVIGVAGAVWVDAEVGIHRTPGMMPLNPVPPMPCGRQMLTVNLTLVLRNTAKASRVILCYSRGTNPASSKIRNSSIAWSTGMVASRVICAMPWGST